MKTKSVATATLKKRAPHKNQVAKAAFGKRDMVTYRRFQNVSPKRAQEMIETAILERIEQGVWTAILKESELFGYWLDSHRTIQYDEGNQICNTTCYQSALRILEAICDKTSQHNISPLAAKCFATFGCMFTHHLVRNIPVESEDAGGIRCWQRFVLLEHKVDSIFVTIIQEATKDLLSNSHGIFLWCFTHLPSAPSHIPELKKRRLHEIQGYLWRCMTINPYNRERLAQYAQILGPFLWHPGRHVFLEETVTMCAENLRKTFQFATALQDLRRILEQVFSLHFCEKNCQETTIDVDDATQRIRGASIRIVDKLFTDPKSLDVELGIRILKDELWVWLIKHYPDDRANRSLQIEIGEKSLATTRSFTVS